MDYERDIFYDTEKLSIKKKKSLINDSFKSNLEWKVDKLDCSISWARQGIDMTFDEIMGKFDDSCHFSVLQRRGFEHEKYIGEVGFSTMTGISYYLWIYLDVNKLDKLINEYKLNIKIN